MTKNVIYQALSAKFNPKGLKEKLMSKSPEPDLINKTKPE
jgi:hypothetical protein